MKTIKCVYEVVEKCEVCQVGVGEGFIYKNHLYIPFPEETCFDIEEHDIKCIDLTNKERVSFINVSVEVEKVKFYFYQKR